MGQGLDGESTALFAHGNLRLAEALQLTGGLRWTRETKDAVYEQTPIPGVVTNVPRFSAGLADTDLSPKIGLNWFASKAMMVYGFYTQGFKSGGYNLDNITTPVSNPARDLRFDKQTVKSAEIGLKSEFADRRVRLNAAAYTMDGTDWQVQQFVPQANNTSLVTITNAGKVKIDGAEVELQAQALESLLVKAGLAYTDARFVTFKNGGGAGVDFDGRRLPFAPRIKTTLSAEHAVEIGGLTVRSSLGYTFTDTQYSNPNNSAPTTIPRFELWNARVALEGGNKTRWSVATVGPQPDRPCLHHLQRPEWPDHPARDLRPATFLRPHRVGGPVTPRGAVARCSGTRIEGGQARTATAWVRPIMGPMVNARKPRSAVQADSEEPADEALHPRRLHRSAAARIRGDPCNAAGSRKAASSG